MKPIFSRSLFAVFLVVAGYVSSLAQTTVTLPTIPCSNCNGPGAFATTAPACTSGLVGAPLTMSWGTASGATSYTIMIATDANLSQNVATYTLTGTSLSVPAVGLKPSVTYYWTVFANNATGSTKATGGPCTFSTNTTWTGTSLTGGFPNGSLNDQLIAQGAAGGYSTCQTGDGTCASGDNLICNPQFKSVTSGYQYAPNWLMGASTGNPPTNYGSGGNINNGSSILPVDLGTTGAGIPSSGTQTGLKVAAINGWQTIAQSLYLTNTSQAPVNYQLSLWAKRTTNTATFAWYMTNNQVQAPSTSLPYTVMNLSNSWTQFVNNLSIPAGASINSLHNVIGLTGNGDVFITDVRLCKL